MLAVFLEVSRGERDDRERRGRGRRSAVWGFREPGGGRRARRV